MRTIIFSTAEESEKVKLLLGGEIFKFSPGSKARGALLNYLESDKNAIAIVVGEALLMGWSIVESASILFTQNYPTDGDVRNQARGRIRPGIPKDTGVNALVNVIRAELKRQYEDKDVIGSLAWYTESLKSDGSLDWVVVDGHPDLPKLAHAILIADDIF